MNDSREADAQVAAGNGWRPGGTISERLTEARGERACGMRLMKKRAESNASMKDGMLMPSLARVAALGALKWGFMVNSRKEVLIMRSTQHQPDSRIRSLALIFAPLLMLVLLLAVTSAMIGASHEDLTGGRRSVDTAIASGTLNTVQHPNARLGTAARVERLKG
jgi:hypothetical protein